MTPSCVLHDSLERLSAGKAHGVLRANESRANTPTVNHHTVSMTQSGKW